MRFSRLRAIAFYCSPLFLILSSGCPHPTSPGAPDSPKPKSPSAQNQTSPTSPTAGATGEGVVK